MYIENDAYREPNKNDTCAGYFSIAQFEFQSNLVDWILFEKSKFKIGFWIGIVNPVVSFQSKSKKKS